MKTLLLLGCCSTLTLHSSASAQVIDPRDERGPMSAVGTILTLEESSSLPGTVYEEVLLKPPGDQLQEPLPWAISGSPMGDYSKQALFPKNWRDVELDAMSTGNAYIATEAGEPELGTQWAAVMISVTNEALGVPGSGWLELRKNGVHSNRVTPGSDLATHYFEGGAGIDPTLLGNTYVSQLAEHTGLNENQDIDSLDVAMGVIASGTGEASRLLFMTLGEFYFSITPDCAADLATTRFVLDSSGAHWITPDAAAIYHTSWSEVDQRWSTPREYYTPELLGLIRGVDDIDAVDVSTESNSVVYSTQLHPGRSQLRVFEENTATTYDLTTRGSPLTDQFYLREEQGGDEGDDVDAVCFFDPEMGSYDNLLGTAVPGWTGHRLGLSVLREADGAYLCQVTGTVHTIGGHPGLVGGGGHVLVSSEPLPKLKIYSSWDFDPWNQSSNRGTWTELIAGVHRGSTTELHPSLPAHNFAEGKPVYFRAEVLDGSTGALLDRTWVSALDL